MEKVFKNGNSARGDNRDILIKIKDGYIEFFFNDQYLRQAKWVEEETERRELPTHAIGDGLGFKGQHFNHR